jgi:aerobic carbon-monoxide dehydrogenase large subunit
MGVQHFGARVARFEDPALLSGKGRYIDDIRAPGALHACFLRSPYGHARIGDIDVSAALALPGVHAVLTAKDLPERMRTVRMPLLLPNATMSTLRTQHCLAVDEVCYVGQALAVVLADSRYIGEDALAHIAVDYDVLPAISDVRDAVAKDAPSVHLDLKSNVVSEFAMTYGDVDAAFASAPHVFREQLWQHRGGGMAMEPRGALAQYDDASGQLTVWSTTQTPHIARRMMAEILEMGLEEIRVATPDVGGGFGPKAIFYPEDSVVAHAARMIERPVKFIEDRREHFMCATQERDQYWDVEIAADNDGRILGVRGKMLHDTGAYVPWGIIMPYIAGATMPGPYVVPAYRLDCVVAFTNKVATTPVRGAGRPQAVFAMERLLDRVAHELSIDPAELRRRNYIRPEQMPYSVGLTFRDGKPLIYDSGDYPAGHDAALRLADYTSFAERQNEARRRGSYIGIGIASYVEGTGLGPFEGVTVRVLPSGKVKVVSGATSQGQGTRTTLAQIVADRVGCRLEDVVVTIGDTATIANGVGAFASRLAVNAGSSAAIAGDAVRSQILKLAARALGTSEDDIDLEDGSAISRKGNRPSVGLGDLARLAQGMPGFSMEPGDPVGLEHTAHFTPPQAAYCSGTHVVEVEVDIGTGAVSIINYSVGHDCGRVINPLVVDGQVQGGVAHGIGNALLEWMRYDENAQPLTTSFADYLLPMATDVPECRIAHVETPSPLNPIGVKGAGEGGTIPAAAAIVAAVENALKPFNVHFAETPIVPDRIVEALTKAGAYAGAA